MPTFRFNKASDFARNVKALLNPKGHALISKRRELSRVTEEFRAAKDKTAKLEHNKRKKTLQQEIFALKKELRVTKEGVEDEPVTGALPDFVVIGGKKCGTTYLHHLLTRHPLVEHASAKELNFFNVHFDLGVEWYRQCFPVPRWEDGRRTITGEATPEYLPHRHAAERMARVIPQARLIALLRSPVDRAYSDYQMVARKGQGTRTFEEAIAAKKPRRASKGDKSLGTGDDGLRLDDRCKYLSRGVYVDHLLRWSEFFPKEQMLVLKSEDLFEHQRETLKRVLAFLKLPDWEPEAAGPQRPRIPTFRNKRDKRNKGRYEEKVDPATRRRLERYFEPHNRRLYDYLGVDFGW